MCQLVKKKLNKKRKKVTFEQKKELPIMIGIILPDMTKEEVLKTLGEPRKTGFLVSTGQEAWYYKAPEEQNIYFKGDKVERVEYLPKEEIKPTREIKQPEEL